MLTISPNLGNAHEYWLVTRTHLRDATMLQENRVADSPMTRKRCPCALCSVIRSSRLQSMVHGSHNTEAQFRAVQLCNEIRIMTLHPVPFSVGVSLGLSLGSVPESELLNPSLKTRSCTSSKGFTTNAFSSDFIRLLAMLLTKLQESGQAVVRPLPQRNTKTSPEAAILCHSFVLHAFLAFCSCLVFTRFGSTGLLLPKGPSYVTSRCNFSEHFALNQYFF